MIPERRIFQAREGRRLLFIDPRDPNSGRGGLTEVWAESGEYVDAFHPVLQEIIGAQLHKVRVLKPGDRIPEGSVFHRDVASDSVRKRIAKFDGTPGSSKPVTSEDLLVAPDGNAVLPRTLLEK